MAEVDSVTKKSRVRVMIRIYIVPFAIVDWTGLEL